MADAAQKGGAMTDQELMLLQVTAERARLQAREDRRTLVRGDQRRLREEVLSDVGRILLAMDGEIDPAILGDKDALRKRLADRMNGRSWDDEGGPMMMLRQDVADARFRGSCMALTAMVMEWIEVAGEVER